MDRSRTMPVNWQDRWEAAAEEERKRMDAAEPSELLAAIRDRRFGNYFTIWYALAAKSTLPESGWTLYRTLCLDVDYLYRYHCAAALLQLMGEGSVTPVDLSADHPGRDAAMAALGSRLAELVGEDRTAGGSC